MTDQDPPASNRPCRLHVRLTEAERATLDRAARSAGMSLSDYVRDRALANGRRSPRKAMRAANGPDGFQAMNPVLFAELSRLGNNLNQIARAFNRGRDIDRDRVVHLVAQTWRTMLADEVTARYATLAEAKVRAAHPSP